MEDLQKRTGIILGLVKDQGLTIRGLEKDLGYSSGALRLRDGKMSGSVLDKAERYFGLSGVVVSDLPAGDHELVRKWGNRRPYFGDGLPRFRDIYDVKGENRLQDNGLWKRYRDWAYIGQWDAIKHKKGELTLKKGWGSTGELGEDTTGEYVLLENGVKVYDFG